MSRFFRVARTGIFCAWRFAAIPAPFSTNRVGSRASGLNGGLENWCHKDGMDQSINSEEMRGCRWGRG